MMNNRSAQCPSGEHLNGAEMLSPSYLLPRWPVRLIAFSGRRVQINHLTKCIHTNDTVCTTISWVELCVCVCVCSGLQLNVADAEVAGWVHREVREANEDDRLWLLKWPQQSTFVLSGLWQKNAVFAHLCYWNGCWVLFLSPSNRRANLKFWNFKKGRKKSCLGVFASTGLDSICYRQK